MSKKFEYKTVSSTSTHIYSHKLNELGKEGRELVSVTCWTQGMGSGCDAYFKREIAQ